jgi:hypothetical protein
VVSPWHPLDYTILTVTILTLSASLLVRCPKPAAVLRARGELAGRFCSLLLRLRLRGVRARAFLASNHVGLNPGSRDSCC